MGENINLLIKNIRRINWLFAQSYAMAKFTSLSEEEEKEVPSDF